MAFGLQRSNVPFRGESFSCVLCARLITGLSATGLADLTRAEWDSLALALASIAGVGSSGFFRKAARSASPASPPPPLPVNQRRASPPADPVTPQRPGSPPANPPPADPPTPSRPTSPPPPPPVNQRRASPPADPVTPQRPGSPSANPPPADPPTPSRPASPPPPPPVNQRRASPPADPVTPQRPGSPPANPPPADPPTPSRPASPPPPPPVNQRRASPPADPVTPQRPGSPPANPPPADPPTPSRPASPPPPPPVTQRPGSPGPSSGRSIPAVPKTRGILKRKAENELVRDDTPSEEPVVRRTARTRKTPQEGEALRLQKAKATSSKGKPSWEYVEKSPVKATQKKAKRDVCSSPYRVGDAPLPPLPVEVRVVSRVEAQIGTHKEENEPFTPNHPYALASPLLAPDLLDAFPLPPSSPPMLRSVKRSPSLYTQRSTDKSTKPKRERPYFYATVPPM
ncbi:hypothetical protein C8R43DRAFT_1127911 [Mycena crocata]|nr:hypothetical protein C8R43DRAFT_1127911 [Mycena crocata]